MPDYTMELRLFSNAILVVEAFIFLFQLVNNLSRSQDSKRLLVTAWVFLTIYYNIITRLEPSGTMAVLDKTTFIVANTGALFLCMYCPFFVYKLFPARPLRFYGTWGVLCFILTPFILLFLLPVYITGDFSLSKKLLVSIPFLFAICFVFVLRHTLRSASYTLRTSLLVLAVYIIMALWMGLSLLMFVEHTRLLEVSIGNTGLMIISLLLLKHSIQESKNDYQKLQQEIQQLNSALIKKELNRHIEFEASCAQYQLTTREKEIIPLIAKGCSNKQISELLFISDKTVAKHIRNIYEKVNVNKRQDLLRKMKYVAEPVEA